MTSSQRWGGCNLSVKQPGRGSGLLSVKPWHSATDCSQWWTGNLAHVPGELHLGGQLLVINTRAIKQGHEWTGHQKVMNFPSRPVL